MSSLKYNKNIQMFAGGGDKYLTLFNKGLECFVFLLFLVDNFYNGIKIITSTSLGWCW